MLACDVPAWSEPSPRPPATPRPRATTRLPSFANGAVPPGSTAHVSAAACRSVAAAGIPPGNALGPNAASTSQTLVALPIGGGNAKSATEQQAMTEACNHRRH